MYDPNDELMQRLAGRNRQGLFSRVKENVLNPSGDNVYKAAMILAGQKPQDTQEDGALETAIKLNQLQTGTPEFKREEAQIRANMNLQNQLDAEDIKRNLAYKRAQKAGVISELGVGGTNMSSAPQPGVGSVQQNIPKILNTESSPIGNMPTSSSGPKYIMVPKSPETVKWDDNLGANRIVPAEYGYELDPKYKQELENAGAQVKEEGKLKVKRSDLGRTVDSFRAISDQMPRKYGVDRFTQGVKNIYSRTMQEKGDPLASASSTYEGARNNLTVAVARLKDVGNLSATEQSAARALVPQDIDSPEVYETKMAYLDALAGASSPEEIKSLLNGFATGQPIQKKQPKPDRKSLEAELAQINAELGQ